MRDPDMAAVASLNLKQGRPRVLLADSPQHGRFPADGLHNCLGKIRGDVVGRRDTVSEHLQRGLP